MNVRVMTKTDFDGWLPLWQGYQRFYKTDIPRPTTDVTFARLTDEGTRMGAFVAEQNGALIGLVHWICHASTWTEADYCYLQDLYVDENVRVKGTGRALIEAVYTKAQELGCNRVYWLTHETNDVAMRLYDRIADKSGFIQYRNVL